MNFLTYLFEHFSRSGGIRGFGVMVALLNLAQSEGVRFPQSLLEIYRIMTQEEFNKQMDKAEWGTVKEAVRLCLEHPCYAQIWYENKYGNEKE